MASWLKTGMGGVLQSLQWSNFQAIIIDEDEGGQGVETNVTTMEIVGNWKIHKVKDHFFEREIVTNYSIAILNLEMRKQKISGLVKMIDLYG